MQEKIHTWGKPSHQALVFLHGLGSSGLMFQEVAHHLEDFYIVSLTLPGHGGRIDLEDDQSYRYSALVHQIRREIETVLSNRTFYLVGHSWGAELALAYAHYFPKRLLGIVLLDGGYLTADDLGMTIKQELEDTKKFLKQTVYPSMHEFLQSERSQRERWNKDLETAAKGCVRETENGTVQLAVSEFTSLSIVRARYEQPLQDLTSFIELPILLLIATLPEAFSSLRNTAAKRLQHPAIKILPIPYASHDLVADQPEQVADTIKKWITKRHDKTL